MSVHRLREPLPDRVVVLRALHLGDLLCGVPAFRALRAALPHAEVTLIGLPWARSFAERFDRYLDGYLEFPGFPGLPEREPDVRRIVSFLDTAQTRRFDLALQMHGSGAQTNQFVALLGARMSAGYFPPGGWCPDPDRYLPYPSQLPEVRRHLSLLGFLGIPAAGEDLEFPLTAEDRASLERVDEAASVRNGAYVCVHPGARATDRRWAPERFAEIGDRLAARGLRVVVTGTAEEADVTAAVTRAMRAPAVDLAGRTDLGALAVLVSGARLVVCNDTGISHLAAALRVPSVVVFSASETARWAPLDRNRHRAVSASAGVERAWRQAGDLVDRVTADVA